MGKKEQTIADLQKELMETKLALQDAQYKLVDIMEYNDRQKSDYVVSFLDYNVNTIDVVDRANNLHKYYDKNGQSAHAWKNLVHDVIDTKSMNPKMYISLGSTISVYMDEDNKCVELLVADNRHLKDGRLTLITKGILAENVNKTFAEGKAQKIKYTLEVDGADINVHLPRECNIHCQNVICRDVDDTYGLPLLEARPSLKVARRGLDGVGYWLQESYIEGTGEEVFDTSLIIDGCGHSGCMYTNNELGVRLVIEIAPSKASTSNDNE